MNEWAMANGARAEDGPPGHQQYKQKKSRPQTKSQKVLRVASSYDESSSGSGENNNNNNNSNEMGGGGGGDDGDSLPRTGYVNLDDPSKLARIRISLNSRSKSEIGKLKRKLVGELDRVRNLKAKLERWDHPVAAPHNPIDINNNSSRDRDRDRDRAVLARVNSEVSYVGPGPTNSRPVPPQQGLKKKEKPKTGGGVGGGGGGGDHGKEEVAALFSKELVSKCRNVLSQLMNHQYGWVFNKPVDVKKLQLHDYYTIIKHPMDLGTVKSRLSKNWYKSPIDFAEDVRLTFNNAMKYNDKGQDAHIMAQILSKLFEDNWAPIQAKLNTTTTSTTPTTATADDRRAPPPPPPHLRTTPKPAPPKPSPPPPHRAVTADKTLPSHPSKTKTDPKSKGADTDRNQDNPPPSDKLKSKDHKLRDMSYQEKQRLSTILQNLSSDKLDTVVQIIRKSNPGLFQQEDEIEVDIDSFDAETLWELDRFVNGCQNSLSNNSRNVEDSVHSGEAHHVVHRDNVASATLGKPIQPGAGQKHGDIGSGSSSSSSSRSNSGSSSSDSDSGSSSGYGSDAGR